MFPTTDFADEIQRRVKILIDSTKNNIMQPKLKYKAIFDRSVKAALLKQNEYCPMLQPITDHQG